ncbi:MAG: hypothetical protein C4527_26250 [Candidatus Omnitrophota bacterium]|jgi:flagellar assembly protein FliH|nr:MAG: hypothetical protein C4527_26250 [Candidatus Omnitrophota bacterium]
MPRIIKAPNVREQVPYKIVEREKVLRQAEDEAADIIAAAQQQEEMILQDASTQADEILASAQTEKEEILNQARAEGEGLKEQARQQGHQQGLNQGLEEARKKVAGLLNQLQAMIAEGQKILEGMIRDQEQEIRKLVSEIVSRVIQCKIEEDDEIVVRVAQECIRMAADRQTIRICVHPDDKVKIEEWVDDFTRRFDDIEKISLEIDNRVNKGGVIVESGVGGIDARIDKQLEIMNETLLNP